MRRTGAVVGVALVALHVVLPDGPLRDELYLVIGAASVGAVLWGVHRHRPAAVAPWLLMAAGQSMWVLGDALYDETSPTAVTWADAAYLAAYPLLALGIADLIRSHRRAVDVAGLVDSAVVTLGAFLLSWVFLVDPIVDDGSRSVTARAVAAAYPVGDVLLLAMVVTLVGIPGARSVSYRLLTGSIVLLVVADTWFAATPSTSSHLLDALWLASYVAWGLAALDPSMVRLIEAPHHRRPAVSRRRLVTLAATALVAPALVVAQVVHGLHVDTWAVVAGASVLSVLAVARVALDLDELRRAAHQCDRLERLLLHETSHDPATGLLNAAAYRSVVSSAVRRARHDGTAVAVLLVAVDAYDHVVDLHGAAAGDEVLSVLASRLRRCAVDADHVGRLGPELLAVCLAPVRGDVEVHELAARIVQSLAAPVPVDGTDVVVSACVGVARSTDSSTAPHELIEQAHVALRRARATGSGTFEVFGQDLRREAEDRRVLERELRRALDRGGLELHYQPILSVQSRFVDGYEARVHWRRPGHGWQDSQEFLAVAALSDLICRIDRWTLTTAVRHLATWTALDPMRFGDLTVAITISGRTLSSPGFLDAVTDTLVDHDVEPHRLTIGVTEMTLVDTPRALADLRTLRDRGVFVAINEFGTGHTPIAQLGSLPADIIKVDPSLVNSTDPSARDMLALLANVAHGCGLLAVAEGVTDVGHLDDLRTMRYDSAQGLHSSTTDPAASGITVVQARAGGRGHLRVVPDPED